MPPLFPDERAIMEEAHQTMTPAQYSEYVAAYIANSRAKLPEASVDQLIAELRSPSTGFPSLQIAIQCEAMARILKTCAL